MTISGGAIPNLTILSIGSGMGSLAIPFIFSNYQVRLGLRAVEVTSIERVLAEPLLSKLLLVEQVLVDLDLVSRLWLENLLLAKVVGGNVLTVRNLLHHHSVCIASVSTRGVTTFTAQENVLGEARNINVGDVTFLAIFIPTRHIVPKVIGELTILRKLLGLLSALRHLLVARVLKDGRVLEFVVLQVPIYFLGVVRRNYNIFAILLLWLIFHL